MTRYLLDTCTCIFLQKGRKEVMERFSNAGIENCFISEITKAELLYGAYNSGRSSEIYYVNDFLSQFKIIPISESITVYAQQKARLRKLGTPIDDLDLFIGSTAIANNLVMVTENIKHFKVQNGIKLENWTDR